MGRIKTKQIKATTFMLLEKFGPRFSKDFPNNKKSIDELATYQSKKMRNAIAGYLTRLKKSQS